MSTQRRTPFRTVALTDQARGALRTLAVELTSPAGRRVSMSDVVLAVTTVARAHFDEVLAELERHDVPPAP